MQESEPEQAQRLPRVVVVGPCASGKSSLVESLQTAGYEAYCCAQEHSAIKSLWNHREPDVVIALDVDLDTVRKRRGETWPAAIFTAQLERLKEARAAAHLVIDGASHDEAEVCEVAMAFLAARNLSSNPESIS